MQYYNMDLSYIIYYSTCNIPAIILYTRELHYSYINLLVLKRCTLPITVSSLSLPMRSLQSTLCMGVRESYENFPGRSRSRLCSNCPIGALSVFTQASPRHTHRLAKRGKEALHLPTTAAFHYHFIIMLTHFTSVRHFQEGPGICLCADSEMATVY